MTWAGGDASVDPESDAFAFSEPVTLQPGDRRGVAAVLNEVRDRAAQLAGDLEQLDAAGTAVTRVQQLVGRLRDVTVVALDGTLQPAQRAALQREVDQVLGEIDAVADSTQVDAGLLLGGADGGQPGPFRAIGTALLGLAGLAVRSSDQALAATGALDVSATRLQRNGRALSSTTGRLRDAFQGLTSPPTTATGEAALADGATALDAAAGLRALLLASPELAVEAQSFGLEAGRVRWLLDAP